MYKPNKTDHLYAILKERIGSMEDGEAFPSVRQLMEIYKLSMFSVSPAVKKLQEQGYLQSYVGRGTFVCKKPDKKQIKIAVLSPDWPSETIDQMLAMLLQKIEEHQYQPEVIKYDVREDIYRKLNNITADAIIIEPVNYDNITAAQLHALVYSTIPVVLSRAKIPIEHVKYATGNDAITGMQMINYLHRHGHTEIAVIISEPVNLMVEDLLSGIETYAKDNKCHVRMLDCGIKMGENALARTKSYLQEYLKSNPLDFTALCAVSYETGIAALEVLQQQGIAVPDELSMISAGNLYLKTPLGKLLTTVGPPMEKISDAVLAIVDKQLAGDFNSRDQVCINPEIFERGSVMMLTEDSVKHREAI